jgi:hypothetical protein
VSHVARDASANDVELVTWISNRDYVQRSRDTSRLSFLGPAAGSPAGGPALARQAEPKENDG